MCILRKLRERLLQRALTRLVSQQNYPRDNNPRDKVEHWEQFPRWRKLIRKFSEDQ